MTTSTISPPKPLTPQARRKMIAERQERSMFWRVVHVLGSLKLALTLLATIAVAIAIATFYESSFNAKIASAYIYKAPWFIFWLGILCINLFAVTITRWPWEKKHTGFIVTHYGIILLLVGAVIGFKFGFEGNVTLHTEKPPVTKITTSRSVLQVESPRDGSLYLLSFDAETLQPSSKRNRAISLPDTDLKLVTDDFSPNLIERDELADASNDPQALPGIAVDFSSGMAAQDTTMVFALAPDGGIEKDFFSMARIAFLPSLPDRTPEPVSETRMIFARFAPVITAPDGSTGVAVTLAPDGTTLTVTDPAGASATYNRADVIGKTLTAGAAKVTVESYWPDFVMRDGRPATASPLPNNPAVIAQISGPPIGAVGPGETGLALEMAPSSDPNAINYQIIRDGIATTSGTATVGAPFALGWSDWTATITQALPKARSVSRPVPGDPEVKGVPGFRARLRAPDGTESAPQWISSGTITTLGLGQQTVRFGYGLELRPIPFTVTLTDFEVPRYEGTETPANFISTVKFTETATGETKDGVAKMNHPASWPGGMLAQLTGFNYKFSQAEWNPRDLNETTLQVLYDPGWLFKWLGSLAICVGIFIQFYLRPKRSAAEMS